MSDVAQLVSTTATRYGVSPALALAVARKESGLNQAARGAAGEVGVMQLMPATAAGLGVDPYDLAENIEGGVRYLAQMLQRYGGNATKALAAYNAGPGRVDRGNVPRQSWDYAADVLARIGDALSPPPPAGQATTPSPGPSTLGETTPPKPSRRRRPPGLSPGSGLPPSRSA
jgi:soluble lytic murein transglycosylase-like protein